MSPNPYTNLADNLADIPVDLAPDGLPRNTKEWLDQLPTSTSLGDGLIDYPSGGDEASGFPLSTRVPAHWIVQIDSIRQMPGTNLPDIFPRRSSFVRWCIFEGMKKIWAISQELNTEGRLAQPIDSTLAARIFLEKKGGAVSAQAEAMNDATRKMDTLSEAVKTLVDMGEFNEAAEMINDWVDGAREQQSPFWVNFLCKLVVTNQVMREHVKILIDHGYIVDEYILELAERHGIHADQE